MPTRFRVWDKLNESEAHAQDVDADSPEQAAELYAERDVDGQVSGIYEEHSGHALIVKVSPDEAYEVLVRVEYTPSYDVIKRRAP